MRTLLAAVSLLLFILATSSIAESLNIEVYAERKLRASSDQSKSADFDDREQFIHLSLKLRNNEFNEINDLKATVYILGEAYYSGMKEEKNTFVVLSKDDFKIDLPAGGETTIETKPYSVKFDATLGARYGATYHCYALIIKNKNNDVVFTHTDRPSFVKEERFARLEDLGYRKPFNKRWDPISGLKIDFPK